MVDFGLLPPEVTSTQIYTGPGSGPMLAAAQAWDALAAQLGSFAQGYSSVISALEGQQWTGAAAEAMAASAAPFVQWATTSGSLAEQTAGQARAAATAYETAHAAVVPPTLVTANRTQLTHLIATNVLGQNAPHIAATEAQYMQMWAQNTQVMHGYAGAASSSTKVSQFSQPPQTTNPLGQANQAAATAAQGAGASASHLQSLSQLLTAVPQHLSAASSSAAASTSPLSSAWSSFLSGVGNLNTLDGPLGFVMAEARTFGNLASFGLAAYRYSADVALYAPLAGLTSATSGVSFGGASMGAQLAGATSAAGVPNAVLASASKAGLVGPLSVPPAWTNVIPAAAVTNQAQWMSEVEAWWEAGAPAHMGTETMAEVAAAAAAGALLARPVVGKALRVPPRRFKMSRPSSGG